MSVQEKERIDLVREFMANAVDNGDGDEQDAMSDRELAEDLWLKAGVEVEWTVDQIKYAVRSIRREALAK